MPNVGATTDTSGSQARSLAGLTAESLAAVREARLESYTPPSLVHTTVSVQEIPGRSGARASVYRPIGAQASTPLPVLIWLHGGGYILGSAAQEAGRLDRWCGLTGCLGIAVDYRLAPEFPYPAALDDASAWLHHVVEDAGTLGADPARVGIGGASAGGGLAAALALRARENGGPGLAFQLLLYPMIDDRMRTPSTSFDDPVWPPGTNRFAWSCYLQGQHTEQPPYLAVPARAPSVAELPRTLIVVGARDPFFDENVKYASRLNHAGVQTDLQVYSDAGHAFLSPAVDTPANRRASHAIEQWLAEAW